MSFYTHRVLYVKFWPFRENIAFSFISCCFFNITIWMKHSCFLATCASFNYSKSLLPNSMCCHIWELSWWEFYSKNYTLHLILFSLALNIQNLVQYFCHRIKSSRYANISIFGVFQEDVRVTGTTGEDFFILLNQRKKNSRTPNWHARSWVVIWQAYMITKRSSFYLVSSIDILSSGIWERKEPNLKRNW